MTNFLITAYCACVLCCAKQNGVTSMGNRPVEGITVAGPRWIPLGTSVSISGLGNRVVQDRYRKGLSDRFDVYFNSHQKALKFGKQHRNVIIHE